MNRNEFLEKVKQKPAEMHVTYDGNGKYETELKGEATMLGYLGVQAYRGIFKNLSDEAVIDTIALAAAGTIYEMAKDRKKQINCKAKAIKVKTDVEEILKMLFENE